MTELLKKQLIRYGSIAGVLCLFFALMHGIVYLDRLVGQKRFAAAAQSVCTGSAAVDAAELSIGGTFQRIIPGLFFRTVLQAEYRGKPAFIVFLPLTGTYGSYTGVFLSTRDEGCVFCGLAGVDARYGYDYYGISTAAITVQQRKIALRFAGVYQE